ncbi:DUF5625 family protein [Pseudoduganella aquatica]|uniref:DUF5625 domain-containing protein n=1 Tax=Pseudoduganella aquatica TaxID=2660641 RepID=A0A7X4KNF5_9BURK|nr:DUF5625 family protein [Pseudoduganella aquatica]MYN09117.1 hypothetical protein [Pseudoduganella aquatica]
MGPLAYTLCQKSVIGVGMFVTGLCAFPPLIPDTPLPLSTAAPTVTVPFTVPVDKSYEFDLRFTPQAKEDLQRIGQVAGTHYDGEYCEGKTSYENIPLARREGLGQPIPVRVVVRSRPGGAVVVDQTFISLCKFAAGGADMAVLRKIGRIDLVRGDYSAEVSSPGTVPELAGIKTSFMLVSGHGK